MATTANQLISTGIPSAPTSHGPFQITGAGAEYQPPHQFVGATVEPSHSPGPIPDMPTTHVPEAWTPSGIFTGQVGYNVPSARVLSIPIQKLSNAIDIYAASPAIPFPFVIRNIMLWAPAGTAGAASDGTIDVRVGPDPGATATAFAGASGLFYPSAIPRAIYCPSPVFLGELWIPFSEGHLYLLAHATSLTAAIALQLVCMIGISPLDDFIGA